ncbi:MAG: DUF1707 domain-containing protein [Streptosporangiales bacterium]|nr:DUF1707 domain-containing protein [Streptosporangiales bacterium]
MNGPGGNTQTGLRASDADRERIVGDLRRHYETGHIGYAEFNHRMDSAYRATYQQELTALLADLPHGSPGRAVTADPAAKPPKERTSAGKIVMIVALVIGSLAGLSWLSAMVTHHPLFAVAGIAVAVWLVVRHRSSHKSTNA